MSLISRILGKKKEDAPRAAAQVFLGNTLSGKKDLFIPLKAGIATMYSCGPTVYDRAHIGNLRAYVFSDTIARILTNAGYHVRRIINITDVGHLVGDGDVGQDKMAVGAAREKTAPEAIAKRFTDLFLEDLAELNIDTSNIQFPHATDYIKEQIAFVQTLEEKGFAYKLSDGVYFDTQRFPGYGRLGGVEQDVSPVGARIKMVAGKKSPHDFALWRSAKPGDLQQWNSPWGMGNPGWHIECSAMIRALLGPEIDIHTGGEDHINVHHNNEIAQSEAATGRQFVRYWMHGAFLTMSGEKASKSIGNITYLSDITAKGFHPLALRYFFLQAHYRTPISFSWDALSAASEALKRLWRLSNEIADESEMNAERSPVRERFLALMRDDLGTPQAIGLLWEALKSEEYTPEEKWGLLSDADAHLGLLLTDPPILDDGVVAQGEISDDIRNLLDTREAARAQKDFAAADALRDELLNRGYAVEDSAEGPVLTKRAR